jgi:hypothetical protein
MIDAISSFHTLTINNAGRGASRFFSIHTCVLYIGPKTKIKIDGKNNRCLVGGIINLLLVDEDTENC